MGSTSSGMLATGIESKTIIIATTKAASKSSVEKQKATTQRWLQTTKVLNRFREIDMPHEIVLMVFTEVVVALLPSTTLVETFSVERATNFLLGLSRAAKYYGSLMQEAYLKTSRFRLRFSEVCWRRPDMVLPFPRIRKLTVHFQHIRHIDLNFERLWRHPHVVVLQLHEVVRFMPNLLTATFRACIDHLLHQNLFLARLDNVSFGQQCIQAIDAVQNVLQELKKCRIAKTVALKFASDSYRNKWTGSDAFMLIGTEQETEEYGVEVVNAMEYLIYGK